MAKAEWTPDAVVAAIQERKRQGQPLFFLRVPQDAETLYRKACECFGSWKDACSAAGIRRKGRAKIWTTARVIAEIKKRHQENLPLISSMHESFGSSLYTVAGREFGSWRQAVIAAGIDYDEILRTQHVGDVRFWSKEKLLEEIKKRQSAGKSLAHNAVREEDQGLIYAAKKIFGRRGWNLALAEAGIDRLSKRQVLIRGGKTTASTWSRESVVREIQRRHQEGLPLSWRDITETNPSLHTAAAYHFKPGGWRAAIVAAGLDPESMRLPKGRVAKWTRQSVLATIRQMHENDEPLNSQAVVRKGVYRVSYHLFGGWRQAITAAGFDYDKLALPKGGGGESRSNKWSKELVVVEILRRHRSGLSLSSTEVSRTQSSLPWAARKFFGSWKRARAYAGVEHLRKWSRPPTVEWMRLPGHLVSIDEPLNSDTEKVRKDYLGAEDPGFAQVEARQMLQAPLDKRKLATEAAGLLHRLILGEDLEDHEYELLASAIREHTDLLDIIEKT